jgi:ABC-type branched-subunit amino acid transport system substrate-binding protein
LRCNPRLGQQAIEAAGQKDFSALVTKIKSSGCTAVFFGGYSPEAGLIRKQMTEAGLTGVSLYGGDGIKDDTFLSTAGAAGDGSIATCPCADITSSTDAAATTFVSPSGSKSLSTIGFTPPLFVGAALSVKLSESTAELIRPVVLPV